MLTPEVRKGLEELLAGGYTGSPETIAWFKRQLEADDLDKKIERMGGGRKARDSYMKPFFDVACSVTAFDMHAQLTTDGRERGLWIWLHDESQARAESYDKWTDNALDTFCKLAGLDDSTLAKFRMSMSMGEFRRIANAVVHESALLEWPDVKKMYAAIGRQIDKHENSAIKEGGKQQ